jgi:hypothetical protein
VREFEQKEQRLQGSADVTVQREADTPVPKIQDTPLYFLLGPLGSTRYLLRAGMMAESRLMDDTAGYDTSAGEGGPPSTEKADDEARAR